MQSPAYIALFRTSPEGTWSIRFPDLPSCTARGHNLEKALFAAQAALARHLGECSDVPRARSSAQLLEDARYDWRLGRQFVDSIMYMVEPNAVPETPARRHLDA